MSAPNIAAEGVTNPSIDDLLTKTDSKYQLVLYSAKRARQINAYYSQLGEGLLEYVGPLVDTHVQEKPLSIALREINEDKLTCERRRPGRARRRGGRRQAGCPRRRRHLAQYADPSETSTRLTDDAAPSSTSAERRDPRGGPALGRPGGRRRDRRLQGVRAAAPAHRVRPRRHRRADRGRAGVRRARRPGRRCRASRSPPTCGRRCTRCRTCASGRRADLVVVAPATADLLAKAAHGLADDLLTNTLLTARCPVVFAPAMHTEMWEHPATRANVATLRARGAIVVEPAEGRLTGKDTGKGRLPEPAELFEVCAEVLARGAGRRPTWPGAASSSRPAAPASTSTRCASSATAPRACRATPWRARPRRPRRRGDAGRGQRRPCPTPPASKVVRVETTAELRDEVVAAAASADAVVMAAAPADFRPADVSDAKIKKAADGSAPGDRAGAEPRHPARDLHPTGPAPGIGDRRLRRRDRRRHRLGARPGPRQAGPQGLRPARRQRRQRGSGLRQPRQRGRDPRRRRRRRSTYPAGSKGALAHVIWDEVARRWLTRRCRPDSPPETPVLHAGSAA